jgi:uncharacterized membrane protein YgaE (UPF0421/DUF939 family)
MRKLGLAVYGRWLDAWREVAAGTLAALLAWVIAQNVFGHPNPMFAAVIALVCLAPGIPSYRKQAWGLVLGVATGIAVSELALLLPHPVLRMVFGLFVSMVAASSFGLGPVVPIQAGVSVLLVLTLGPETAGYIRMIDVLIGAAVGAVCGRFLSALKSS